MSQSELLRRVVLTLEQLEIAYMVTGSVASSMQGQPRSTHDVDLVVAIAPQHAKELAAAFPAPDYHLSETSILDAIRHQQMFNLLDVKEGDKVDFWILTAEPFDQSRFARRQREDFLDVTLTVSCPEDTILAKLHWAKQAGGSEKQFNDALGVYEVQFPKLDMSYLTQWARQLGVESLWQRLQNEAKPI